MIHYIVLMQERAYMPGAFHTIHFYKKGEGNEVPKFVGIETESVSTFKRAIKHLYHADFRSNTEFTIEEMILSDVAEVTVFFFKEDGSFDRIGIYRRVAA